MEGVYIGVCVVVVFIKGGVIFLYIRDKLCGIGYGVVGVLRWELFYRWLGVKGLRCSRF